MCGIAGFLGRGDQADLARMNDALVHRGPDAEGRFCEPRHGIWLGHRRLAVVDRSGGAQPMWTPDGVVGVVYNGEIYNHAEMRRDLESRGHVFHSSHSDTEVLLHGWREWGERLLERLNGMFAFALVDRSRDLLFLARDRFGQKPLYYASVPGVFAFASELTAVTRHAAIPASLSREALLKYFAYGWIPAPHTLLEGVAKLPAGGSLTVSLSDRSVRERRWWEFRLEPEKQERPIPELAEALREHLSRAVGRRMLADVPVGLLLSGGLDSSALAALARHGPHGEALRTFSIGFEEPSFDESGWASRVAEHLGTDHRCTTFSMERARQSLEAIAGRLDEPIADPSLGPTYLLCGEARREVTVALGGDGGDELFAGYHPLRVLRLAAAYARLVPTPVHAAVRAVVARLPVSHRNLSLDFLAKRTLRGLSYPAPLWHPTWMGTLEPRELEDLFAGPVDVESVYAEAIEAWDACEGSRVDRSLTFFTRLYLTGDILPKVDRASMLHSLEVRSPFLDVELVDFVRKLPHDLKLRRGETKFLLRRAVEDLLPASVIRRGKKGFGMPIGDWLRRGFVGDVGLPGSFHRSGFTECRYDEHRADLADHRQFLFAAWLAGRVGARLAGACDDGRMRSEAEFLRRIAPLVRADLEGAAVLDAGCGTGLASCWSARCGATRVVAVDDAEPTIDAARAALARLPGTRVERRRLCDLSFTREFDVCLCLDGLDRATLANVAVHKLLQSLRPGGTLVASLRDARRAETLFADVAVQKLEIQPMPGGAARVVAVV